MRVDIGAGARTKAGYFGLDINPKHADALATALDLPFVTGSIEAINAVDVLEHISYRDTDAALDEWHRVLEHGGELYVQVPDAFEIMRRFFEHELDRLGTPPELPDTLLAGVAWRLLGGHRDGRYVDAEGDWRWNAHYSLWDAPTMSETLYRHGFTEVEIRHNEHPNLLCTAVKL